MAGLVERERSNSIWLQIVDRNICQRSGQEREGWEKYTTDKSTAWLKRYKAIEDVFITDIRWFERQLPNSDTTLVGWNLRLEADNQAFVLQMPTNPVCSRFMKLADNINFSEPVSISAWKSVDKGSGKENTAFCIHQNGANVPQAWNKDNLPEARQSKTTKKWDFSEQEDFLIENMNTVVIPRLQSVVASRVDNNSTESVSDAVVPDEEIPF
jgi:hypothetical protein